MFSSDSKGLLKINISKSTGKKYITPKVCYFSARNHLGVKNTSLNLLVFFGTFPSPSNCWVVPVRWFANKTARFHLEAAVESGHKTSRLAGQFFLRWVFWGYLKRTRKITGETKKRMKVIEMSILIIYIECMKPFGTWFFVFHSFHFPKI